MLAMRPQDLEVRATGMAAELAKAGIACRIVATAGAVGGGTFPGVELPSTAIEIPGPGAADLARALRAGSPPVIARVADDVLLLDLRTVLPGQEDDLVRRVKEASAQREDQTT
jgi:L-seryl-tRNA(Ser) seleniumtransferase